MYKTMAEADAAGAARYAWTCPECGLHGGAVHLATCRFIRSGEQYNALQDEIDALAESAAIRIRTDSGAS